MIRRGAYLTVILLLLASLAVAFGGCGGDEQTPTTAERPVVTTERPPGTSGGTAGGAAGFDGPLETSDATPAEYVQAVEAGKPVVLLFYVPGNADDAIVLETLSSLEHEFTDYEFLVYDYSQASEYGDLPTLLNVNYPPQLVLVDSRGVPREIYNGFVDEGTLNQSLVNLGRI